MVFLFHPAFIADVSNKTFTQHDDACDTHTYNSCRVNSIWLHLFVFPCSVKALRGVFFPYSGFPLPTTYHSRTPRQDFSLLKPSIRYALISAEKNRSHATLSFQCQYITPSCGTVSPPVLLYHLQPRSTSHQINFTSIVDSLLAPQPSGDRGGALFALIYGQLNATHNFRRWSRNGFSLRYNLKHSAGPRTHVQRTATTAKTGEHSLCIPAPAPHLSSTHELLLVRSPNQYEYVNSTRPCWTKPTKNGKLNSLKISSHIDDRHTCHHLPA